MSVHEAGAEGRPIVVLLHGAMYDEARFSWDQLFPTLAEQYHVYAVDTPRHGSSRPWTGRLTHRRLLTILEATFQHLALDTFHLVGLSMGGGLAIGYAASHPRQVDSMVLFEPGGLGRRLRHHFPTWLYLHTPGTRRVFNRLNQGKDAAALGRTLASFFTRGTRPTAPGRLAQIIKEEIDGKARYTEADLDDWQVDAIGAFRLSWNLLDEIPALRCPTLWLRGAESTLVTEDEMAHAVSLACDAELRVIPNVGHLLPLEQPDAAAEAVLTFLERMEHQSST
ncbi:MAG: alpha/beta hydrolase [Propionibacteriaceae bacterium]|nr:alpha/beta hydrolase [Propionibacteriaceae bacterium]